MGSQGGFSDLEPLPPETGNWTEENGAANCLAYYQQYEQEGKPVQKSNFFPGRMSRSKPCPKFESVHSAVMCIFFGEHVTDQKAQRAKNLLSIFLCGNSNVLL